MSFRLKTILGIALIQSVLLIGLVITGMNYLSEFNESNLQQRVKTTSILLSQTLKDAVLSTDLATIESFTEDILTIPDIVFVRISNNTHILSEGGDLNLLTENHAHERTLAEVTDGVFDIEISITEGDKVYGEVEIGLSTQNIQHSLDEAQKWATSLAFLVIVLVAFFSYILGTYLTRSLQRLKTASETIARAGPGHQIPIIGNDEISEVGHALNRMSSTLAVSYAELSRSVEAERKMSAIAQRNQAKNNAILTASLDAIITIDQSGVVVDYNSVAEQTFGWSYAEIFGKNLSDFIIPQHKRHAHHQGMQQYLLNKQSAVINQRLTLNADHKKGHSFPIEINIAPIEIDGGIMFTAFIRDITESLQAETELRLAAQTFESSEAIFITDAQGNILRSNRAFSHITGYENEEVLGKNPRILSSGQSSPEFYKNMWEGLINEGKWNGEIYNKRKDGEIYPEYLNISSIKDSKGNITHYIAHSMDISEQKQNEENLRAARIEAEASNESKSRFLAAMSHEIRTPMNAVLGILGLLKDTPLNEGQHKLVGTARDSGELLLTIINDILDFTKMDIDKLQLEEVSFDLHLLLTNCLQLLQHLAQKKSLQLSLQIEDDVPQYVKGDPDRIRQILINLINNAIKFSHQGSVHVIARLEAANAEGIMLHIEVGDTGIGISSENQPLLFNEFTMVDQTHSRQYEGTGLGLAICKRLVNLMQGTIKVSSELGKGSTFAFTICLKPSHQDEIKAAVLHKQTQQFPRPNTRVLLAEDNLANQMVIKSILEFAQLRVDVVADGYEAIEAVQHLPYDIVLMDISMPGMDGMLATKTIRALSGDIANIPIIALTAHSLSGDKERFMAAGMNDYLSKPIDRAATLNCIARWTKKAAPQDTEKHSTTIKEAQITIAENDCVDEAVLQQLVRDTDASIVPELIFMYIEDCEKRMLTINKAIAEKKIDVLEFETHAISSSALAHGNGKLGRQGRQIELLCRRGEQQQALSLAVEFMTTAAVSFKQLSLRATQGF